MSEQKDELGRPAAPSRAGVMYSRLFARNPNDLYGLYCPGCGYRVCQVSVFSNAWTGRCPSCGVRHSVHSVVAVPDRMQMSESLPIEEVQPIFLAYLDDVSRQEYEELDAGDVFELAEAVGVEWSPFDPLFRRRVGALDGQERRDTVRTQMIYTKSERYDLDPHLRTSELTYYAIHGFLPMWGQEQVALDNGLDGWGMWAAYEILKREAAYQAALGHDRSLASLSSGQPPSDAMLSFLEMVIRRYNLKFDPRELQRCYQRVEAVSEALYEQRDQLHEEWARSLTTEYGHKSFDAGFHDRRHELTGRNSFDELAAATAWVEGLEERFETEWERTLTEARGRAGKASDQPAETARQDQ